MRVLELPPDFDHQDWITPGEQILDNYEFVEPAGEGRISVILKVVDRNGTERVIKTIKPAIRDISTRNDFSALMAMTDREAQLQSVFQHPNIVRVVEYGFDRRLGMCIVLEYAPFGSLKNRIARHPLEISEALEIVEALLFGLMALHAPSPVHPYGIAHLDMEPKNIVFGDGNIPKICDFHYARRIFPTPDPNDFIDENHLIDIRTDLKQVGKTLYEMLTGQEVRHMDMKAIPDFLHPFIKKLVASDPGQRYQSAHEARRALDRIR
jgi:serine/threonine protein kinase